MAKKARKIRLSPTRKLWAEQRGGAVFVGKPLSPPDVVEAKYHARLQKLVESMITQTVREIDRLYKSPEAPTPAMDASFASMAAKLIKSLQSKFNVLFSDKAGGLADALVNGISRQSAVGLGQSLKEVSGGVTLRTDVMGGAVADVVKASVKQNVALIKSIPQKYLEGIEGEIMRSIQTGRGMADLQPYIEKLGQTTKKRAALIARDQTSKATTAINQARMQGLGVKKFKWLHSMGGKEPRPLHKNVLNGNVYSFDDLPVIDERTGERGLPGQLINCFTGSTKVSLANGCRNLWRYRHSGEIVRLGVVGHPVIEATLNHPILTGRGWLTADEIQEGDYLASSKVDGKSVIDSHDAQDAITFADLYVALVSAGNSETASGAKFDFHGDVPKGDVDCVSVEADLSLRLKTGGRQEAEKLVFTATNSSGLDAGTGVIPEVFHPLVAGGAGESGAFVGGHLGHAEPVSAATVAQDHAGIRQDATDDLAGAVEGLSNLQNAHPLVVHADDCGGVFPTDASGYLGRELVLKAAAERAGEVVFAEIAGLAELCKSNPRVKGFHRVEKKDIIVFTGHVYTMETDEGWYSVASTETISKNCRCRMVPVVEFKAEEAK